MRTILPGRPQSRLQAATTGSWEGKHVIAYISGNALVILDGPNSILQTTYLEPTDELVAVVFDELSGKIAVASASTVYVYRPYGRDEGALKWSLQCHLEAAEEDAIECLSWGLDEELLVGSSELRLYSTYHNQGDLLWTKSLANPARFAHFSCDTSLIASAARYDRLVKIWRRLSLADSNFDYAYLPHPAPVMWAYWKRPFHREQTFENVLYTICAENTLRIWSPGDDHGFSILQLWGQIDLTESIQPRSLNPEDRSSKRYAFIIDNRDFTASTERVVQNARQSQQYEPGMSHLIEVATKSPDICVVLDDRGNMSAWGLESVGCKHRKPEHVFNIAHTDGIQLQFDAQAEPLERNVQFYPFADSNGFCLLVHHFDGRLDWYGSRLDQLFDPAPQTDRLKLKTTWTGHSGDIKKMVRSATGRALVSRTTDNESIVWTRGNAESGPTILRKSTIRTDEHVHRVWLLQEGRFVAFLHHDALSLWDARSARAEMVDRRNFRLKGMPICLLCIPEEHADRQRVHLATVTTEMEGWAWEVTLPTPDGHGEARIEDFGTFQLGKDTDLVYMLPVDPAGSAPVTSAFLDLFARDVAISYSRSGLLNSWTARPDLAKRQLEWLRTSTVDTMIEDISLGSATSIRKAALVDEKKTTLTIWNTRSAQLEYEREFDDFDTIEDLDWLSTPDNQSILAVGFPHRVVVYGQLRYDYLDAQPAWAPLREISIRDLTPHPIGDSVWLSHGGFVIAAGTQLFVQSQDVDVTEHLLPDLRLSAKEKSGHDLFTVVSRLNGPLPVFHPQFLSQLILSGKIMLAQRIVLKLWQSLKFYSDDEPFDIFLGFEAEDISSEDDTTVRIKKELSSYADFTDEEPETVTEEVASSLNEMLATKKVPYLTAREQIHLVDIIECIGTVERHRRSIDENGCRFLLFFRQYALRKSQHAESKDLSWREIVWAFFSESQDILADLVSRHFQGRILWAHARESGMFMWMTDITALRQQFEVVTRNEYAKSEDKNPIDCSLYYCALKKKAVLVGLWRMATWHREQKATQRFLSNNFDEQRWKTAALKNAYALMGKHRFEYACAFFLLAGALADAVSVLSNQLGDIQLAIAVARVYEGDDGPVLRAFLQDKVLPRAILSGDRWLAVWALWMLGRRDAAVQALVLPLDSIVQIPEAPGRESKSFLRDDPALVVLYRQLRERSLQTLRGAVTVGPKVESDFVLRNAFIYARMGCDLLALGLVRNWEFLVMPREASRVAVSEIDPRKMLRRRSSLVVADLPVLRAGLALHDGAIEEAGEALDETNGNDTVNGAIARREEGGSGEGKPGKKPPPTQFKEPDANSLLDSFGF